MPFLLSGVDINRLKENIYDEDLLHVFTQSFSLLQLLGTHVSTEYWSVCKDIEYWRRVTDAGAWEAYYITYFNQGPVKLYEHLCSLLRDEKRSTSYANGAHLNIITLKASLSKLARLLAGIQAIAEEFKRLLIKVMQDPQQQYLLSKDPPSEASFGKLLTKKLGNLLLTPFRSMSRDVEDENAKISPIPTPQLHLSRQTSQDTNDLRSTFTRENSLLHRNAKLFTHVEGLKDWVDIEAGANVSASSTSTPRQLKAPPTFLEEISNNFLLLQKLCDVIYHGNKYINFQERFDAIWQVQVYPNSNLTLQEIAYQCEHLVKFFVNSYATTKPLGYPLEMNEETYRRPSYINQNWISFSLLGITCLGVLRYVGPSIYSGEFQKQCLSTFQSLQLRLRETIVDPVHDLVNQIFLTIRHRELVVSRDELIQSHQALTRMLVDYANKYKTLPESTFSLPTKESLAKMIGQSNTDPIAIPVLDGIDAASSYSYKEVDMNKAMDSLMIRYEEEMKNPIQGFLFGSLMTSMLIQMQKLKVHTEAAMLTMDQILASNELTLALSSSIPAFLLGGGLLLLLNNALMPRRQSNRNATLALRMTYVELQRALSDLYLESNEEAASALSGSALMGRASVTADYQHIEARGVLVYRLFRFSQALHDLFSSNYAHWMTNRYSAMTNQSKTVRISEYIYIVRDVSELLAPDFEINSARKLATAARMGSSYKCLAAPPS